ncbi:MAG: helix-turn-helix transcriptional regulator [Saprospiraceae bacterium]|nr:helix-turn-helix transcriptional regulator [Saprospiraceae bacterium]
MKKYTLEQVKDELIGKPGTPRRDAYEIELKLDLIGELIRETRKKRNLTQEELGQLIGVQKAQISKIESNTNNFSLATILKIFKVLNADVKLKIELKEDELILA